MKNQDYYNQAKAYLEGTMNSRERQAFEAALDQDEARQKAFLHYAFSPEKPASAREQKLKEMLEKLRRQKGPLPEPQLNFFDRLRFAFSAVQFWKAGLGFLIALMAGLAIWANLSLEPVNELIEKYFIEAYCPGYAGDELPPTGQEEVFGRASALYCGYAEEGGEGLKVLADGCAGFCMADYYLAHWQLKNGQFEPAIEGFEQCLANRDSLLQYGYASLARPVRLNLLLARLGAGHSRQEILEGLQAIAEDKSAGEEARAAEDLLRGLGHPLRVLVLIR
ncbi:MAG: hypothetical protein H6557_09065 [Lewinellaceae bacterium]|nr:hypothetical protein [Phaeodactylibacter sp.]MCB9036755.1 hypothetical protein [Lewinellaceae bacterium]